jgi:hypothetical protein
MLIRIKGRRQWEGCGKGLGSLVRKGVGKIFEIGA